MDMFLTTGIGSGTVGSGTAGSGFFNIVSNMPQTQMQPPNEGLNLNEIRNHTTLSIYTQNSNGDDENDETKDDAATISCEICHDNINNNDILRTINVCNHSFHQECVDSWFENNTICPYCRGNVIETVNVNEHELNLDLESSETQQNSTNEDN